MSAVDKTTPMYMNIIDKHEQYMKNHVCEDACFIVGCGGPALTEEEWLFQHKMWDDDIEEANLTKGELLSYKNSRIVKGILETAKSLDEACKCCSDSSGEQLFHFPRIRRIKRPSAKNAVEDKE